MYGRSLHESAQFESQILVQLERVVPLALQNPLFPVERKVEKVVATVARVLFHRYPTGIPPLSDPERHRGHETYVLRVVPVHHLVNHGQPFCGLIGRLHELVLGAGEVCAENILLLHYVIGIHTVVCLWAQSGCAPYFGISVDVADGRLHFPISRISLLGGERELQDVFGSLHVSEGSLRVESPFAVIADGVILPCARYRP